MELKRSEEEEEEYNTTIYTIILLLLCSAVNISCFIYIHKLAIAAHQLSVL